MSAVPHHLAIVMDGNGRWATRRFLPRVAGHRQGLEALRRCASDCAARGVRVLTVFAFSSENWARPAEEVSGLMELLGSALVREVPELSRQGVQLHFVGDAAGLAGRVVDGLRRAERATAHNQKLVLNVCFNYGGRWDIAQAAARLAAEGCAITPEKLDGAMALAHVPHPDMLIRTGGELRLSNFLLWQCAYSELVFTDCLWPDFDGQQLDLALQQYAQRQRRFGLTPEQAQPGERQPTMAVDRRAPTLGPSAVGLTMAQAGSSARPDVPAQTESLDAAQPVTPPRAVA
jgi:undecaprenyl diphosphate synthase